MLCEALRGRVTGHHRFLLGLHLEQIDALDAAIDKIDQEVDASVEPFRAAVGLLTTIPGVSELAGQGIVAEIGIDMSRFPTAGHLISWAGLCPEERRERRQAPLDTHPQGRAVAEDLARPVRLGGDPDQGHLPAGPVPPHQSPARAKKAIVAVAASILTAAYHMLKNGIPYRDLGPQALRQPQQAGTGQKASRPPPKPRIRR